MGADAERDVDGDSSSDSSRDILHELLAGNADHVETLPEEYFAGVQDGQHPDVVSICCSDSRVPQERMWGVDHPGAVFTPSNIGNQVWDADEGERIVDGGLLYPIHHAGTEVAAVVGHTGCGAVTAAYEAATGGGLPGPRGVDKWIELLVPVVEAGLESDRVDATLVEDGAETRVEGDVDDETVVNQLVEFNVDRQVEFLRDAAAVPDDVDVYGFVYDFQGVYGDEHGRAYLVNCDGETKPDEIAARIPAEFESAVRSLLW